MGKGKGCWTIFVLSTEQSLKIIFCKKSVWHKVNRSCKQALKDRKNDISDDTGEVSIT